MTNNKEIDEKNQRFITEKVRKNYQDWLRSTSVSYNDKIVNLIEEVKHTLNNGRLWVLTKYILFLLITTNLGLLGLWVAQFK